MKNKVFALFMLVVGLVFSGCGSKEPFKAESPVQDSALVYVYVVKGVTTGENASHGMYNLRINGKRYLERIETGEYLVLNVKPNPTLFSAVKSQIIEEHVKLDLKAGDINYLRITDNNGRESFSFEQVSSDIAKDEISNTGLAGSNVDDPSNIITELIGIDDKNDSITDAKSVPTMSEAEIDAIIEKKLAQRESQNKPSVITQEKNSSFVPSVSSSGSDKMSKIKEAYEMKQQGMISESEFHKLKSEILAK